MQAKKCYRVLNEVGCPSWLWVS